MASGETASSGGENSEVSENALRPTRASRAPHALQRNFEDQKERQEKGLWNAMQNH
jgi:hypothetical protein